MSYHAPQGHFAQTVGYSGQSFSGALAVEPGRVSVKRGRALLARHLDALLTSD